MQDNTDITPQIIEAIKDKKGKKIVAIDLSDIDSASTGETYYLPRQQHITSERDCRLC